MNNDYIDNNELEILDDMNTNSGDIKSALQNTLITGITKDPNKILKVGFAGLAAMGIAGLILY